MNFIYPVIDTVAVGIRIRDLRKQNKLTVEDISSCMGFESVQAVYKWQRGDSLPTVDNLFALSKLFGTSIEYILEGENEGDVESPSYHLTNSLCEKTYFQIKLYIVFILIQTCQIPVSFYFQFRYRIGMKEVRQRLRADSSRTRR